MRLVFLGPPGSGKGTQARILAQGLGIPQITVGPILRKIAKKDTLIAKRLESYMSKGKLIPDDIAMNLVYKCLENKKDFILDGFPRNLEQAKKFDQLLSQLELPLEIVFNIVIPFEELMERLLGRLICEECNSIYHIDFIPPKQEELCDLCGAHLSRRPDDREVIITQRFETYREHAESLVKYYEEKGNIIMIDGTGTIDEIAHDIEKEIRLLRRQ